MMESCYGRDCCALPRMRGATRCGLDQKTMGEEKYAGLNRGDSWTRSDMINIRFKRIAPTFCSRLESVSECLTLFTALKFSEKSGFLSCKRFLLQRSG